MSHCSESPSSAVSGSGEIMLFGVKLKVDPMRKSVSMNNLSDYEPPINIITIETPKVATEDGYASADDAVRLPSHGNRERKRGVPWTEEEHKLFLIGLQKVGKGDWRGISRNYVKTRNPTQVASHAQKYFLRRTNLNRRRRRSSLFDITTDSAPAITNEEGRNHQTPLSQPVPPLITSLVPITSTVNGFSIAPFSATTVSPILLPIIKGDNPMENPADQMNKSSRMVVDLNLNQQVPMDISPLSLRLSLSSTRDSSFQAMPCFRNEEGIICVS